MTILEIGEEWPVSKTMMKKMNIINGVAPAFLIGQLCKADDIFDPVGKTLTEFAIARFNSVRTLCGGRVICVDCKKELIKYYESQGFVLIITESEEGLYRMVLLL